MKTLNPNPNPNPSDSGGVMVLSADKQNPDLLDPRDKKGGDKVCDREVNGEEPGSKCNGDESVLWPAERIRSTFIKFFTERGHKYWESSPVVPLNDPTLLFSNAGMNQFKPLFQGTADPSLELSQLTRAVNSQKCIRAGGKHNDLDDVGKDVYHHTFFEMLGNWSFADYFKADAIRWAWECLTETFGIPGDRLYATYFEGDESLGLPMDEETKKIWSEFLPESRILPGSAKDNFWEMGEVGPCGPCTELHFDRIGGRNAAHLVNADLPDVLEIWDVVFIQFNRDEDGSLKDLPNKHVDTGMGFERLASILQGKASNYDTDLFQPLFRKIRELSDGQHWYQGRVGEKDEDRIDTAYRVVADHIRTLCFAISDGAVPSNDGRGYVLRRVLRRGVRYGQQILGTKPGFFHKLVPTVVEIFKDVFPELVSKEAFVTEVITEEEMSFNATLNKGLHEFHKRATDIESGGGLKVIPGPNAFFLYSTMGFPLDLTQLIAEERGFTVDVEGFHRCMKEEHSKSKDAAIARKNIGSTSLVLGPEQTSALISQGIPTTSSISKYTWHHEPSAKILALYIGCGEGDAGDGFVTSVMSGQEVGIIIDNTPFYAEQGGQIHDTGVMAIMDGSAMVNISNVQPFGGYVVHSGLVDSGHLVLGETLICKVDYVQRSLTAPNHTMTHVLNFALRTVLCGGVDSKAVVAGMCEQKGSLVDANKLRFDFSWSSALTYQQLHDVEAMVQSTISQELPVYIYLAPLEQASKIKALRQVFGEAYPNPVRVISVGQEVPTMLEDPENPKWSNVSVEFCGGTHLRNTSEAVAFTILEECGIAKGIRRIVAVTKDKALHVQSEANRMEQEIKQLSALSGSDLEKHMKRLSSEVDKVSVGSVRKQQLKKLLVEFNAAVRAYKKKEESERLSSACRLLEPAASSARRDGRKHLICLIDELPTDAKLGGKVADSVLASWDGCCGVFLVTSDKASNRFQCYVSVPKGGNAKEWIVQATADMKNVKISGKGSSATCNGKGLDGLSNIMSIAEVKHPE